MAIRLEFVNLIIPIGRINNSSLEGGFAGYIKDKEEYIGKYIWFDEYLLRIGWMDYWGVDEEISFWENCGLNYTEVIGGIKKYKDMLLIYSDDSVQIDNCDWIVLLNNGVKFIEDKTEVYFPNKKMASYNFKWDK